jgi:hypothetical protein
MSVSSTQWMPAYPVPQLSSLMCRAARVLARLVSSGRAFFLGVQVGAAHALVIAHMRLVVQQPAR